MLEAIAMVRCRLLGGSDGDPRDLRYVPLGEFELWRHLMENRHRRAVKVEAVSVWLAEEAAQWNSGFAPEDLEPVLHIHLELQEGHGVMRPVDRFFPAETYPQAQEALLSHYEGPARPRRVVATPGYFVPPAARRHQVSIA
jgi:hypothetical protein